MKKFLIVVFGVLMMVGCEQKKLPLTKEESATAKKLAELRKGDIVVAPHCDCDGSYYGSPQILMVSSIYVGGNVIYLMRLNEGAEEHIITDLARVVREIVPQVDPKYPSYRDKFLYGETASTTSAPSMQPPVASIKN